MQDAVGAGSHSHDRQRRSCIFVGFNRRDRVLANDNANVRTTVDTYGHLANEDLRAPLELLPKPTEKALPPRVELRHVPNMCQPVRSAKNEGPGADAKSAASGPILLERNTGFEPATFALARRRSTS